MAELPNRERLESDFAKRFGKAARRHEREFRKLLGDPPRLENVPQEFWDKMEHETEHSLYPILLLIFDESSLFHGWDDIASGLAAFGWAKQRAENLSTQWVESTRNRLQKGFDKITTPESPELETVATARQNSGSVADQYREQAPFNRISEYFEQEPTKEEVDEIIDSAFGPSRIAQNAVDETTRARHAGGEAAIVATVGISELDEWRCQEKAEGVPDDKVCPICRPMNRKRRKNWPWRRDAGPPCHPNDRCWVWYAEQPVSEAIGRMLDDPDYKSLNAIPKFNLKSWYRQIPNAAEWRVHCRESLIDVEDQTEFKSWITLKPHGKDDESYVHVFLDDEGKISHGPESMIGKKPSSLSNHSEIGAKKPKSPSVNPKKPKPKEKHKIELEASPEASESHVKQAFEAFRGIPEHIAKALTLRGIKFHALKDTAEILPEEARGISARGYGSGTIESQRGGYYRSKNAVFVSEYGGPSDMRYRTGDTKEVARHETGHAVDAMFTDHTLSDTADFKDAYARDVSRLKDDGLGKSYEYFIQASKDGHPSQAGRSEAFAEGWAAINGGGCIGEGFKTVFKNSIQVIKRLTNGISSSE